MKRIIILLTFFLISVHILAQDNSWKRQRFELILGVGSSQFFGDLGGGTGPGKHFFSVSDIDWALTQPSAQLAWRAKLIPLLNIKIQASYGIVKGSDFESDGSRRNNRGLSFKSNIWELATQFEFNILKENRNRRLITYKRPLQNFNLYLFGGFGAFYFNPKAQLDGKWYALQPLGTEGQGIGTNPKKYSQIQFCFPVGMGMKYYLSPRWSLGVEVGNRFTTTDYIDDASDKYFDNSLIESTYGTIAAQLADRRIQADGTDAAPAPNGTLFRGNPKHKDAYMFVMFNITYTYMKYRVAMFKHGGGGSRKYIENKRKREKMLNERKKQLDNDRK